ncbi:hypothetical protein Csa_014856 [Cucumis sativus]|uniref:Uncharacterized protein n=1 Tax=Cucumis sativus TaxID=3659 RepID=A0A0A0KVT0_CUCSA|nr:hypothetical protein Csa_014856 [Cucumis sativus]
MENMNTEKMRNANAEKMRNVNDRGDEMRNVNGIEDGESRVVEDEEVGGRRGSLPNGLSMLFNAHLGYHADNPNL